MITCHIRYVLDPTKIREFERYGKTWIPLVRKFGGIHHGYLLPSEGASNIALASFSFPSLAAYEEYRTKSFNDPECQAAFRSPSRSAAAILVAPQNGQSRPVNVCSGHGTPRPVSR